MARPTFFLLQTTRHFSFYHSFPQIFFFLPSIPFLSVWHFSWATWGTWASQAYNQSTGLLLLLLLLLFFSSVPKTTSGWLARHKETRQNGGFVLFCFVFSKIKVSWVCTSNGSRCVFFYTITRNRGDEGDGFNFQTFQLQLFFANSWLENMRHITARTLSPADRLLVFARSLETDLRPILSAMAGNLQFKFPMPFYFFFSLSLSRSQSGRVRYTRQKRDSFFFVVVVGYRDRMGEKRRKRKFARISFHSGLTRKIIQEDLIPREISPKLFQLRTPMTDGDGYGCDTFRIFGK